MQPATRINGQWTAVYLIHLNDHKRSFPLTAQLQVGAPSNEPIDGREERIDKDDGRKDAPPLRVHFADEGQQSDDKGDHCDVHSVADETSEVESTRGTTKHVSVYLLPSVLVSQFSLLWGRTGERWLGIRRVRVAKSLQFQNISSQSPIYSLRISSIVMAPSYNYSPVKSITILDTKHYSVQYHLIW